MLSSQTKDTMTVAAMDRLLERGFTVQYALDIDIDELAKIIYPVGFWRVRQKDSQLILFHQFFLA
jgi:endonuclease III